MFLSYVNITKLFKFKIAATRLFLNSLLPKFFKSLADIDDVHRSAIMQDFRDNFISAKVVMGYHCVRPYILLNIHRPAIFLFLVT